jgi:hypothetical protein
MCKKDEELQKSKAEMCKKDEELQKSKAEIEYLKKLLAQLKK